MTNEGVFRTVMEAWGEGIGAAQQAMRVHLTEDCPWEQAGLPTTTGGEEAAQLMGSMEAMGFSSIAVEFRNVAAVGDLVFTERVDWLLRPDGSRLGPAPVVGVAEFRDGKILCVAGVLRQSKPRDAAEHLTHSRKRWSARRTPRDIAARWGAPA